MDIRSGSLVSSYLPRAAHPTIEVWRRRGDCNHLPDVSCRWLTLLSHRLTTLAVPLLLFPRLVTFVFGSFLAEVRKPDPLAVAGVGAGAGAADAANVAATTARVVRALNPLEKVLATFAGMVCLAMASMLVIQVSLPGRSFPHSIKIATLRPSSIV